MSLFSRSKSKLWLAALGLNAVIFFWAIAAMCHYRERPFWQLELKVWALIFIAIGPPNFIVGLPLWRVFKVEEGRALLFLGRLAVAVGATLFLILWCRMTS